MFAISPAKVKYFQAAASYNPGSAFLRKAVDNLYKSLVGMFVSKPHQPERKKRVLVVSYHQAVHEYLIPLLIAGGYQLRVVVSPEQPEAWEALRQLGAEPVSGSFDHIKSIRAQLKGCDMLIYWPPVFYPGDFVSYQWLPRAMQSLIKALDFWSVKKLVYVSLFTSLLKDTRMPGEGEVLQESPGYFNLIHALLKTEEIVLTSRANALVLRPAILWGEKNNRMLAILAGKAAYSRPVFFNGGRQLVSTCHAKNLCAAILKAMVSHEKGKIYYIADGEPVVYRRFVIDMLKTQPVNHSSVSVSLWMVHFLYAIREKTLRLWNRQAIIPLLRARLERRLSPLIVTDTPAREELAYQNLISMQQGMKELAQKAPVNVVAPMYMDWY